MIKPVERLCQEKKEFSKCLYLPFFNTSNQLMKEGRSGAVGLSKEEKEDEGEAEIRGQRL